MRPFEDYAERCAPCEGIDYPGLIHNPYAPYCVERPMSDEDVIISQGRKLEDMRAAMSAIRAIGNGADTPAGKIRRIVEIANRFPEQPYAGNRPTGGGDIPPPIKHDKKLGRVDDIERPQRYCVEHKRDFSITEGCEDCRKAGLCPYYGRGCSC